MARLLPAELAALAVGVKPATLRVWRFRGLLVPSGGTDRRPLYSLADLHAAKHADKPRLTKVTCGETIAG
nr:hypothetical protein [Streptomyces sp. F2]